jgi:hypothetical protein
MVDALLVLWGESYRFGGQMTRGRGGGDYFKRQQIASKSHIGLIKVINEKFNMKTKVFINTYKLNDTDDEKLRNFYSGEDIIYNFYETLFDSEHTMLNNTYDVVNKIISNNDFKFILFVRIDLYLKKYFIKNVTFDDRYIKFAHIDSIIDINRVDKYNICQQIVLYPKKYFYTITNKIIYNATHEIRDKLIECNVPRNDIKYFVNTLHICSTDLGWNPLYIQVGRGNCVKYEKNMLGIQNMDYYYDEDKCIFIKDYDKTILFWKSQIEKDISEEDIIAHAV